MQEGVLTEIRDVVLERSNKPYIFNTESEFEAIQQLALNTQSESWGRLYEHAGSDLFREYSSSSTSGLEALNASSDTSAIADAGIACVVCLTATPAAAIIQN